MTCRSCGATIADKAIVCYRCGTATADPAMFAPKPMPGTPRDRGLLVWLAAIVVGAIAYWFTPDWVNARERLLLYALIAGVAVIVTVWRRRSSRPRRLR